MRSGGQPFTATFSAKGVTKRERTIETGRRARRRRIREREKRGEGGEEEIGETIGGYGR